MPCGQDSRADIGLRCVRAGWLASAPTESQADEPPLRRKLADLIQAHLDLRPSFAKRVSGHLGLALTGKDAFAVSHDAAGSFLGPEIGKVPDMFAHDEVQSVEYVVIMLEKFGLEFFGEHDWGS